VVAGPIIAGDGYAYVAYTYGNYTGTDDIGGPLPFKLRLLRVSTAGAYDTIEIQDVTPNSEMNLGAFVHAGLITNADTGVLLTWGDFQEFLATVIVKPEPAGQAQAAPRGKTLPKTKIAPMGGASPVPDGLTLDISLPPPVYGMAITTGTSVSTTSGPAVPGQTDAVIPVLQAQDGSFVGQVIVGQNPDGSNQYNMVAFDATGAVRWVVPNEQPQIATADGGVIGQSGITYDANGNATGQINMATYSWTLNAYQNGSVDSILANPIIYAFIFAAAQDGNPSGSRTYVRARAVPQEALYKLAIANLTASSQCDALLTQFATIGSVTKATLIAQLQATANRARNYVFDGPSSNTPLDPIKFPNAASPGVTTVSQWFAEFSSNNYADGLSQQNGDAVYFRFNDWFSWLNGWSSKFQIVSFNPLSLLKPGQINYYGMGTVMHEILHKQAVGGGFTHDQMDQAIGAVGWPGLTLGHNNDSEGIGKLCFGNLQ
jgi:hypothetical protein